MHQGFRLVLSLIAEIQSDAYDIAGRKVFRPDSRRHSGFRPTFPIGRFLSQPLKRPCSNLDELREFLTRCKYVSDQEQFGQKDYWQPPEHFEEGKKGDCDDFALWAWRQLLQMKYDARFVVGTAGRYGAGHAWVTFNKDGKSFLLEPLSSVFGPSLPRLSIIRYAPEFSVSWEGEKISYYEHEGRKFEGSFAQIVSLCLEWLFFWIRFWLTLPVKLGKRLLARKSRR
jgi:hypothetical protein